MRQNKSMAVLTAEFLNAIRAPLFWIMSALFTLIASLNFYIRRQFFTGSGTSDLQLFFSFIPFLCIIAIPALCFRTADHSYEDFIPLSQAKKLFMRFAVSLLQFALMLLPLIPSALLVNFFGSVDYAQLFISLFCLVFYASSAVSCCIFINELIPQKILSLVVSALLLGIINTAHLAVALIDVGSLIAALARNLSFAWHFTSASNSVLDTRDVMWFVSVTAVFLLLAACTRYARTGLRPDRKMKIRLLLEAVISILVLLNGQSWFVTKDLSASKAFSLSSYTRELLARTDSGLKITYYRSPELARLYPQVEGISDFLTIYARQNRNISLSIKSPDKDEAVKSMLEGYGVKSQQLRTVRNNSTEYVNVYSAVVLEYNGNAEVIPFTLGTEGLEYDLDVRYLHLMSGRDRVVNIIIGNGMSLSEDYSYVIPLLTSQGFLCNPIFLQDPNFQSELEASQGLLLLIGDGEIPIESAIAIESYILSDKGGVLLMLNPYNAAISEDWALTEAKRTNIVEMVESWGVQFPQKIAADIACARITMYSQEEADNPFETGSTYTQVLNYPLWIQLLPQTNARQGCTVFWATPLITEGENALPYLITSSMAYTLDIDRGSPQKLLETNPFYLQNQQIPRQRGELTVGAKITGELQGLYNLGRSRSSNITVIADQYFLSTLMTGYIGGDYGDYRNFDFTATELLRLNGETELASIKEKQGRDTSLYKISDSKELEKYRRLTLVTALAIIPSIIILLGVILCLAIKLHRTKFYSL